jgi:hypothetical protein
MSKEVHTHRLNMSIVLAAIVVAAALPVIAGFARENGSGTNRTSEGDASQLVASVSAPSVATGTTYRTAYKTGDPAHAASMLIVGSLLIGIGTLVRRAA